ncbi:CPBP family intramembrane glutamic endopeptidase [Streptococcus himalayensis]|uniref:CAAX amino protease n=1 Tax=Streptococcus himalayensis TaxID=1888195 RepID=A0A917A6Z8_9STRE|nr:type II CAAX endopeptidase family protein [Streptococcus himalayensis]GGE32095.1 CAAX amino protease [Streptococcus himalayensis]
MKDNRILVGVYESAHPTPVWLVPVVAILCLIGGEILTFVFGLIFFPLVTRLLNTSGFLFIELGSFAATSLVLMTWIKYVEKRSIQSLGFFQKHAGLELLKGIAWGFLAFSLLFLIIFLAGGYSIQGLDMRLGNLLYALAIFPFWLIQGGTEELLTRSWMMPELHRKCSLIVSILLSSSFFAILHMLNQGIAILPIVNLILFSIFACLYLLYTDHIWGVAGFHAVWNFAQGNLYGTPVSGHVVEQRILHVTSNPIPDYLSGGNFGPEGSIFTTILFICASLYLYRLVKKS